MKAKEREVLESRKKKNDVREVSVVSVQRLDG